MYRSRNRAAPPGPGRDLRSLVRALAGWYVRHGRDLPWRRCRDPYAIWVSEVMLQQTQVKTVVPYWKRWMRALPTVRSLARERLEKILKLWEGLGYYRRAGNMHKAARLILKRHGGRFPRDKTAVLALPGIGPYTAGAICSIAFDQPEPVLDGNVIRVLSRLYGIAGRPQAKATQHQLWERAEHLLRTAAPCGASRWNQAVMELGALVCLPKRPRCRLCPVRGYCTAWRTGRVQELPSPKPRQATLARRMLVCALEYRGRFLVRRRGQEGLNAGLWEFPYVEISGRNTVPARRFLDPFGLRLGDLKPLTVFRHSITRFRITVDARYGRVPASPSVQAVPGRWLPLERLRALPLAGAHRKVLDRIISGADRLS